MMAACFGTGPAMMPKVMVTSEQKENFKGLKMGLYMVLVCYYVETKIFIFRKRDISLGRSAFVPGIPSEAGETSALRHLSPYGQQRTGQLDLPWRNGNELYSII